jgi:hypothetical protein
MKRNNSVISDLSLSKFKSRSPSSSSHDDPSDWTYPHIPWIKFLYEEMLDQGFYEPHVSTSHRSERTKQHAQPDQVVVKLNIVVHMTVCCLAPTKTDFINALGFIQPLLASDGSEVEGLGPSRAWF